MRAGASASSSHPFSRPPSGQDTTPTTARPQPLLSLSLSQQPAATATRTFNYQLIEGARRLIGIREQIARYWDIAS